MKSRADGRRGFSTTKAIVAVAVVAVFLMALRPSYEGGYQRSKVSRVKSDQRSLATAIETYFVDNHSYPAMTMNPEDTLDAQFYRELPARVGRTFRARNDTQLLTLTTPIAYVTSNFPDPFASTKGIGFRYYSDGRAWLLGSWGMDRDEKTGGQLLWDKGTIEVPPYTDADKLNLGRPAANRGVESAYNAAVAQPSLLLLTGAERYGAFTYDPTNGTVSAGDVYRVKQ